MSWEAVARKDFQDAVRSRWLWVLGLLFVAVFSVPTILRFYLQAPEQPPQGNVGVVQIFIASLMKEVVAILVPIIAIVVAYAAISRERESGTMKLLLSLPHSRSDVVFGKVLGRSAVIALPVLVGFVVAAFVLMATASGLAWVAYVQFALLTALLGVVFVGLAVGISAAADTNQQAMVGSVGAYFFFSFFWNSFANRVADAVKDVAGLAVGDRYLVALFLKLLNPIQSYKTLVDSLYMPALNARMQMFGFFLFVDPRAREALGKELPVVFQDGFVLVYLLAWLFVPVAAGLSVFRARDL